jgi:hypothetical protein
MPVTAHDFVIVIPVADRPRQLDDCLSSLTTLRQRYPYPGAVSVLVVDDSLDADNLAQHQWIARRYTGAGLDCRYLSQHEQRDLVDSLPASSRERLTGVIGAGAGYAHKGASITRNIAYLWLSRLPADGRKRLFWFIDSDQEFRVNRDTVEGEVLDYAIDYFSALDRIFSDTPARILTGKVVGDPPVSPAVMAGTFLDDVLAFVDEMAGLEATAACGFHGAAGLSGADAAYHDMADLFGFKTAAEPYRYPCPLTGAHDHVATFAHVATRLNRFFDGEHPTRRSTYQADDPVASVKPARTIYTGNYVFTPAGLDWFIPFAALKLRMAGPTLGRLIQAELGGDFVTANLPMLHKRTVDEIGRSEFRPGIEHDQARIDLSGEFERQYFGDVMLFSIERLTAQGFPDRDLTPAQIGATLDAVEAEMRQRYALKQAQVVEMIERLDRLFSAPAQWWWHVPGLTEAHREFRRFIDNMRGNFGAETRGWHMVASASHAAARKAAMAAAIHGYRDQRAVWRTRLTEAV